MLSRAVHYKDTNKYLNISFLNKNIINVQYDLTKHTLGELGASAPSTLVPTHHWRQEEEEVVVEKDEDQTNHQAIVMAVLKRNINLTLS